MWITRYKTLFKKLRLHNIGEMLKLVFYFILALLLCLTTAAPSRKQEATQHRAAASAITPKYPNENVQLAQPHYITLEDFETLLRRAGELFRPSLAHASNADSAAEASELTYASVAPYEQMQPPAAQPYNFYLPLFEYAHTKLDAKSKRMESFAPPPVPSKRDDQINYYTAKPKKLPKKFNAGAKHVNMKWLNAFEKEALTDASGHLPKAVYLQNDERNRINFDDSFFAVDTQVRIPNNQVHSGGSDVAQSQDDGETADEDDLIADAAVQMPQQVRSA